MAENSAGPINTEMVLEFGCSEVDRPQPRVLARLGFETKLAWSKHVTGDIQRLPIFKVAVDPKLDDPPTKIGDCQPRTPPCLLRSVFAYHAAQAGQRLVDFELDQCSRG